jgi:hypothetical protein
MAFGISSQLRRTARLSTSPPSSKCSSALELADSAAPFDTAPRVFMRFAIVEMNFCSAAAPSVTIVTFGGVIWPERSTRPSSCLNCVADHS